MNFPPMAIKDSTTNPRLSAGIFCLLVSVVLLSPVPFASNRPVFVLAWATLIGASGVWFSLTELSRSGRSNNSLSALTNLAFLVFLAFVALQASGWEFALPLVEISGGNSQAGSHLSLARGDTIISLISFMSYGLFYYMMSRAARSRRQSNLFLVLVFVSLVAYAAIGLLSLRVWDDTLLGLPKLSYQGFATGTFVNRNSFASFIAAGIPVGLALMLKVLRGDQDNPAARGIGAIAFVTIGVAFLIACLLATGSRMGVLAGVAGAIVTLLLGVTIWARSRWSLVFALLAIAILIALSVAFGPALFERLFSVSVSAEGRSELYGQVWNAIMLRPWLGYGGGSFAAVFPLFQVPPLPGDVVWDKAHSTYLSLWFEFGLIFGSIPIAVVAAKGLILLRAIKNPTAGQLAAFGSLVIFACHSTVDFSLEIPANCFLMLSLLAIGGAELPHPRIHASN